MAWLKTNQKQYKSEQKRIDEYMDYKTEKAMKSHKESSVLDHPDGSVTDEKIGERTVIDASADSGDFTGLFSAIINNIANAIRSIRSNFNTHKNNSYIHIKDEERQNWNNNIDKTVEVEQNLEKAIEEQREYVDAQDSSVLTAANNFTREKVNEVNDFAQTLDQNIADIKTETAEIGDDAEANTDKLNSLKYYGDMNIVPSDASLFSFTTDDEKMTASVSAASKGISGDIVIPYQYVVGDKVYLVTSVATVGEFVENDVAYKIGGFEDCSNITSVIFPSTITSISDSAFGNCGGLTSVIIPESVTNMGRAVFAYCSSLTSVHLPDGITSMGEGVFFDCTGLKSVNIPQSITSIDRVMFANCSNMKNVVIPENVTHISEQAFSYCGCTNVTIRSNEVSVDRYAFHDCDNLTIVSIPKGLTSISYGMFYRCFNLSDIYYEGTEEEWNAVTIDEYNTPLLSATIHYNWVPAMKGELDEVSEVASMAKAAAEYASDVATGVESTVADIVAGATYVGYADRATFADNDTNGNSIHDTYATKNDLSTVESIAKGANQAESFDNYEEMLNTLKTHTASAYNIGQNIYIKTVDVPDLWISGFKYPYVGDSTYPEHSFYISDDRLVNDLKKYGGVQIGIYEISMLETQKVDLTEYPTKEEVNAELGNIDTALDSIIAIQNTLIGGDSV